MWIQEYILPPLPNHVPKKYLTERAIGLSNPPFNDNTNPILKNVTFIFCSFNFSHDVSHLLTVLPKKEFEKSKEKNLIEGMSLIKNKFSDVLKSQGLILIEVNNGDDFDAEIHEAITQIPVENDKMKGKIIDVIEYGYKLGDKIIRYPKVVVGN